MIWPKKQRSGTNAITTIFVGLIIQAEVEKCLHCKDGVLAQRMVGGWVRKSRKDKGIGSGTKTPEFVMFCVFELQEKTEARPPLWTLK